MMEFIVNNWSSLIILPLLIFAGICYINNEKRMAQDWLLKAVSEAEKDLGGGTGTLKLRTVYEWFIKLFPVLSRFLTFKEFSDMVDIALDIMKQQIETNKAFNEYINN